MTARGTDWGLAALVAALVASGGLTLLAGSSGGGAHSTYDPSLAGVLMVNP